MEIYGRSTGCAATVPWRASSACDDLDFPTLGSCAREMQGRCGEMWGDMGRYGEKQGQGWTWLVASPGPKRRFWEIRLFLGDSVRFCEILLCRWRPHSPACSGPRASGGARASAGAAAAAGARGSSALPSNFWPGRRTLPRASRPSPEDALPKVCSGSRASVSAMPELPMPRALWCARAARPLSYSLLPTPPMIAAYSCPAVSRSCSPYLGTGRGRGRA